MAKKNRHSYIGKYENVDDILYHNDIRILTSKVSGHYKSYMIEDLFLKL